MNKPSSTAMSPLVLLPFPVSLALLVSGRVGSAIAVGLLGLVRVHLMLLPAADRAIDRALADAVGRLGNALTAALLWLVAGATFVPAWAASRLFGPDPFDRDGASGWRPRGHDTGDPTDAPAHRRRPSPLARAVVAVVLIGALAATIQIRRDRGDDASEAMPAALAGQPEVGRMQAEEGAAFDAMVPDRQLGWVLPQSSPGKLVAVEHGHRRTLANGDAGPVVWIFGGSAAWGSGQRDGHTIAAELSRLAAASRRPIRVVNFGVFAYTAAQEAAAFERATNEHDPPDLVIFYDGYNDVEVSMVGQLEGLPAGSEAVAPLTVLRGSRVLHREEGQPATTTDGRVAGVIAAYARAMSAARSTAQAHGVEVVQVWQPNAFTRDLTAMERQDLEDRGYSADIVSAHAELHAKIRAALPAEVIDLSDALDDAPTVYLDPVHTSERGAAIVAAALYRQINSTLDHLGR